MEYKKEVTKNEYQNNVLFQDACAIIDQAQVSAYRAVDVMLIKRNWLLGLRIQHDVLKEKRAEYGEQIIENLAIRLTIKYGKGFIKRNLHHFVDFFVKHPDFFYVMSGDSKIVNAVSSQLPATNNNIVHAVSSQSSMGAILQSLTAKSHSNQTRNLQPTKTTHNLNLADYNILGRHST